MDDDLNTADAISALFEIVSEANVKLTADNKPSKAAAEYALNLLSELGGVLGLLSNRGGEEVPAEVTELLEQRKAARAEKNWAKSDEIRDRLGELGYTVKDTRQGQQLIKL